MKLFNVIGRSKPAQRCQNCAHFQNKPELIEEAFKGLTSMSSGFASVRAGDGLCNLHEIYLSEYEGCKEFADGGAPGGC